MRADFEDVIDDSAEVLIEDVQKVSLLSDVKEQLIVLNIVAFNWLIWIKVLLDFIDALLQRVKRVVAHLSQIQ